MTVNGGTVQARDALSGQVRGVVARAERVGFEVKVAAGEAAKTYVVVGRREGNRGLAYFRITQYQGAALDTWLQYRHWPQRSTSLAELRSILTELATS